MKEQIYLAPGANGAELMKSLAMHGINSFNVRIVGAGELARLALMRCGISITEGFVRINRKITHQGAAEGFAIAPYSGGTGSFAWLGIGKIGMPLSADLRMNYIFAEILQQRGIPYLKFPSGNHRKALQVIKQIPSGNVPVNGSFIAGSVSLETLQIPVDGNDRFFHGRLQPFTVGFEQHEAKKRI